MNTDGVPVFNSSNVSIYPIQFIINELPARIRKKHVILSALWCGPGKPKFSVFFKDTIEQLATLSRDGFDWILKGNLVSSTVDLIATAVDSVARGPLQNIIQFNGHCGCSWCELSGENFSPGCHVYRFFLALTRRTKDSFAACADEAEASGEPVIGVRGHSILEQLPHFNIIDSCVFDSMHAIDLGVVRQLARLWFKTTNSQSRWYIKPYIEDLNLKLRNIYPPSNITRLPRKIQDRAYWKASEWRNFLLFYGPLVLKDVLPSRFYKHFLLLSESVYILSQNYITQIELFKARLKIEKFVKDFEKLYGLRNMSFNVHILLHACDTVSQWGPLWAYSAV